MFSEDLTNDEARQDCPCSGGLCPIDELFLRRLREGKQMGSEAWDDCSASDSLATVVGFHNQRVW